MGVFARAYRADLSGQLDLDWARHPAWSSTPHGRPRLWYNACMLAWTTGMEACDGQDAGAITRR